MDFHHVGGPAENVAFRAIGYFVDAASNAMERHVFEVNENSGVVSVEKMKGGQGVLKGLRWPIKYARTKKFDTRFLSPCPVYYDLFVEQGLILPFQSVMEQEEWEALPFGFGIGIKQTMAEV